MKLFIVCILFVIAKAFPQAGYSENVSTGEFESLKAIVRPKNRNEGNVKRDSNEMDNSAAKRDEKKTKSSNTALWYVNTDSITSEEKVSRRINNKKMIETNLGQENKHFSKRLVYVYRTKIDDNGRREETFVLPFVEFENALRTDNIHRINKRQVGGLLNPPQSEAYASSNSQYAAALSTSNGYNNGYNNGYPYGYNNEYPYGYNTGG